MGQRADSGPIVHDDVGNHLNIYNFNICLTQELMNNVIHVVWHVSIRSTAIVYSSYHIV
jgi:hypothetical protein